MNMPRHKVALLNRLCRLLFFSSCGVLCLCVLALPIHADDQEGHDACVTEWCDAVFPPPEGTDRSVGKDNCGNVCIKIQSIVEVEKAIYTDTDTDTESVAVTLSKNERGEAVMTATCPKTRFNKYDLEALKFGADWRCVVKTLDKAGNKGVYCNWRVK